MSRRRHRKKHIRRGTVLPPQIPATIDTRFGTTLEQYVYRRIGQAKAVWPWVVMLLTLIVLGTSVSGGYFTSSQLLGRTFDVVRVAAESGDYARARTLYESQVNHRILGANAELEELIYPEKRIAREIDTYKALDKQYPHDRDILLQLVKLYEMAHMNEDAQDAYERARTLDPNNEIFRK